MKRLHYFLCIALCLSFLGACSDDPDPVKDAVYTLSANRTTVFMNETVTFSLVSDSGKDVTADCTLISEGGKVVGNSISWDKSGTHIVKANYNNGTTTPADGGNIINVVPITVVASDVPYILSSDKTKIAVDETVSFFVRTADGTDITAECSFCSEVACFTGNSTSWAEPGTHTITAHHLNNDPEYPGGVLVPNEVIVIIGSGIAETNTLTAR